MVAICFNPGLLAFSVGELSDFAAHGRATFGMRWLGSHDLHLEVVGCAETPEEALQKIRALIQQAARAGKKLGPVIRVNIDLALKDNAQRKGVAW